MWDSDFIYTTRHELGIYRMTEQIQFSLQVRGNASFFVAVLNAVSTFVICVSSALTVWNCTHTAPMWPCVNRCAPLYPLLSHIVKFWKAMVPEPELPVAERCSHGVTAELRQFHIMTPLQIQVMWLLVAIYIFDHYSIALFGTLLAMFTIILNAQLNNKVVTYWKGGCEYLSTISTELDVVLCVLFGRWQRLFSHYLTLYLVKA